MLSYAVTGYYILRVSGECVADYLELCRKNGWDYCDFTFQSDGSANMCMRSTTAKRAVSAAAEACIPIDIVRIGGLPKILLGLFRRPGLWIGGILAICLLFLSSRFVWDVRVSGNTRLTEREVEMALRTCGFGVGSYLGEFKADRTENRVLMHQKEIAWISVNMKGTVAYVQIRETASPKENTNLTPANVVADVGGQIVRVELSRGNVVTVAGKWVDKGDLLISGIYGGEQSGIRYTHAEGRVYARVVEEISIAIPLSYERKTYATEKEDIFCEKYMIFFENYIKFSKKTFNSEKSCDIIKRVSVPFSKTGADLPIALETRWYVPYTVTTEKRTYAEAEALAYLELSQKIGSLPGGAEVLSKTITTTLGEDTYFLTCTLECIRDIAKEQTFEVLP